jgi:hypothetical protein
LNDRLVLRSSVAVVPSAVPEANKESNGYRCNFEARYDDGGDDPSLRTITRIKLPRAAVHNGLHAASRKRADCRY